MNHNTPKTFPTVNSYAEAIANPEGRFATLSGVRAVEDAEGTPRYLCGTGRVTFRILLEGEREPYELTCFTTRAAYEAGERYGRILPDELYVFGLDGEGRYCPVALRPAADRAVPPSAEEQPGRETEGNGEGELCEGLRVVVRGDRFGYADAEGRMAIEPRYVWAGDFSEGRAPVAVAAPEGENGLLMGLIDREGNEVIAAEYDDLSWDGSRYAYVDRGGRHGCIDRTGRVVVPLAYDWIGEFDYGFALVKREGRYGYVDEKGELAGEGLIYRDARPVGEGGTAEVLLPGAEDFTPIRLF